MKKKITKKELSAIHRDRAHKFWDIQNQKRAKKLAPEFEKILVVSSSKGLSHKETALAVASHFLKTFRNIKRK